MLPGETALAFYRAKNTSDQDIIGIATYNMTPDRVSATHALSSMQSLRSLSTSRRILVRLSRPLLGIHLLVDSVHRPVMFTAADATD